jgi:hypothetical protein
MFLLFALRRAIIYNTRIKRSTDEIVQGKEEKCNRCQAEFIIH